MLIWTLRCSLKIFPNTSLKLRIPECLGRMRWDWSFKKKKITLNLHWMDVFNWNPPQIAGSFPDNTIVLFNLVLHANRLHFSRPKYLESQMPQTIQPKSITVAVPIIFVFLKHFLTRHRNKSNDVIIYLFILPHAVFWLAAPLRASCGLPILWTWVSDKLLICVFRIFLTNGAKKKFSLINISISRSQSWERDGAKRKFCDILKGWSLVLLDWQPTRDRLSLKAEQLLAASFSQRGLSLFCFNQTLQSCLTAPLRLMTFNCSP